MPGMAGVLGGGGGGGGGLSQVLAAMAGCSWMACGLGGQSQV